MPKILFMLMLSFLFTSSIFAQNVSRIALTTRGASQYQIVIPQHATENERTGASDLQQYLKTISGATLPIVDDGTRPQAKEIVLGQTTRRTIETEGLGEDGFIVQTFGEKLFLTGGSDQGSMYAVYHFLETYLGCRKYSSQFSFTPHNPSIRLSPIMDRQVPAFTFREVYYHDPEEDPAFRRWHRLDLHDEQVWGSFVHTFNTLVPPNPLFTTHPEYFAEINGKRQPTQLCLSNEGVLSETVQKLQQQITANPKAPYWSVSQNDNEQYCQCPICSRLDAAEGAHSASVLKFVNQVAEKFPTKTISTLAYQYSRSVPKTIVPAPNVNIMLTSIECDRSQPLDIRCKDFAQDVKDWGKRTHNIFLWDYVIQFSNLISPFPNLRTLQPNLRFMRDAGLTMLFQQGNREVGGDFSALKAYLIAKLVWNPDADVKAITDDFLQHNYGKAAPFILQYINSMHDALERSGQRLDIFGGPTQHLDGYLSPAKMDEYGRIFDKAEAAVRNEPDMLERVKVARMPLQYALLEQGKYYGTTERGLFDKLPDGTSRVKPAMRQLVLDFIALCKKTGVTRLHEWETTPDEYLEAMLLWMDKGVQKHLALGKTSNMVSPPSPKYQGGNTLSLTDGILGSNDFRYNWLGWEGDDLQTTLDMGEVKLVSSLQMRFLQDIRSWIFMPLSLSVEISEDGQTFKPVGSTTNTTDEHEEKIVIQPFDVKFAPHFARFIRIVARNRHECPTWHAGASGKAWIFTDEIIVH
jgi:hypothetical protein